MLFNGWYELVRMMVVGGSAYIGLVFLLRVTGKRTLSKMNAFDLVVTVALGSTLATALLNRDVSLSEALFAFGLLCALQYGVAWASVRSERFQRFIKAEPSLLFANGHFLSSVLAIERVTREEVLAAVRAQGIPDLSAVAAVVLETDGSFSVIPGPTVEAGTILRNVKGASDKIG